MISTCAKSGQWEKALELFDEMKQGLEPDVITYSALIVACATQWNKVLELFDEMKGRDLKPNIVTYGALISACGKNDQWQKALEFFTELKDRGLEPNIIIYSSMISASPWEMAVEFFDELKTRGLEPDVITYNAMISAYEKAGQWEKAIEVFDEMEEPNVITYDGLISACEVAGQHDVARRYFVDALHLGCYPKILSVSGGLDLHDLSVPVARTAVRVALLNTSSEKIFSTLDSSSFFIITGRGLSRTDGESGVLGPAIETLCRDILVGGICKVDPENAGKLLLEV